MLIECRRGHIFPWGGNQLAASVESHGPVANALAKLPGCEAVQDGENGVTVRFDFDLFGAVAKLMKPRRKHRATSSDRQRLSAAGQKTRF